MLHSYSYLSFRKMQFDNLFLAQFLIVIIKYILKKQTCNIKPNPAIILIICSTLSPLSYSGIYCLSCQLSSHWIFLRRGDGERRKDTTLACIHFHYILITVVQLSPGCKYLFGNASGYFNPV